MTPDAILIVEDTPSSLLWLTGIAAEIFPDASISTGETLAEARQKPDEASIDLMLVDLGMPDGSGLDLIREIREKDSATPYIVVTTIFDDNEHLRDALRLGANGYLLKDDDKAELLTALKNLVNNRPPFSTRSLRTVVSQFKPDRTPTTSLTKREEDVLRLIAKGYNVNEAADMLGLTANTVKGYLKTVYSKLNISSRAEATAEAIKRHLVQV
jgi:DNA-binding NarL/FixJ family response regulator